MNAPVESLMVAEDPLHAFRARFPNRQRRRIGLYAVIAAVDGLAVILAFALASLLLIGDAVGWQSSRLTGIIFPLFMVLAFSRRAYDVDSLADAGRGTARSVVALGLAAAIMVLILDQLHLLQEFNRWLIAYGVGLAVPLVIVGRVVMRFVASWALHNHPVSDLVIVDGIHVDPGENKLLINARDIGISADVSDPMMLDRVGKLIETADRVMVACAPEKETDWKLILKGSGISGEVRTASPSSLPFDANAGDLFGRDHPNFSLPSPAEIFAKRLIDLFLVIPGLVLVGPLLLVIAIAIKLDSAGPILFVQERIGRGNRLFRMYKFRTMRAERCDANGGVSASRQDDRVTRVGRWLRATSMDELPQLFNVVGGSMSMVGPRPHALGSTASEKLFWDIDRRYWLRHACAPGITGLAQVRGFRGATHHSSDLENRLAADLEYMHNWSLWLDIKILLRTFGVVVHKNAF